MEIRWIDRDKDGKIIGDFARKQRDGQESIAADAPELVARNNAALKAEQESILTTEDRLTLLEKRIVALELKVK
jgi:hypothetical protein